MISERFALEDFIPAPGQGALAVICRTNNLELIELLKKIEDPQSRAEFEAEHSLLEQVEGGCRFPVGAVAVTRRGIASKNHPIRSIDVNSTKRSLSTFDCHCITLYVNIFSADGTKSIKLKKMGSIKNAKQIGVSMGQSLIERGALDLARGWREAVEEWNRN
jgi:hydroxymethylbilane synthase